MIKSIILEVLVAANSVPRATYIPPQTAEQQLLATLNTQIDVVESRVLKRSGAKAAEHVANLFANDIKAEMDRRLQAAGYSPADVERALNDQPDISTQLRNETVGIRDEYSTDHTVALRPVHEHLTKNGVTPFEATRRTHSVALKDDASVATLLQIFSGASIEYKEEVFESMARDAALHALRARTKKESDFTFARFIGKTKGLATPQGESIREAVASLPQDSAYDANAAYFVHHPRMLSRAPFGDAMLEMARTYPLTHIIAEAHRTMRREDGVQTKSQEQLLALGSMKLEKADLYAAITQIRQESREPTRLVHATNQTPYIPRVREPKVTEVKAAQEEQKPQILTPAVVEPEYRASRIVLFGSETHSDEMARFAAISPVPCEIFADIGQSQNVLNAAGANTLVIIYGKNSTDKTLTSVRRQSAQKGALPVVCSYTNANRILQSVQQYLA